VLDVPGIGPLTVIFLLLLLSHETLLRCCFAHVRSVHVDMLQFWTTQRPTSIHLCAGLFRWPGMEGL